MPFSPARAALAACTMLALGAGNALAATELLMVEQAGCIYCERWHAEVGPEYPITQEGRAAPLRLVTLRDMPLPDIALARPVTYTPTFILLQNGAEAGRIEGYPGEDFFWGLLSGLLAQTR